MANKKFKIYPDDLLFNQQEINIDECEEILSSDIPTIRKKYGLSERRARWFRRKVRQTKQFWDEWHEHRHHLIKEKLGYTADERDWQRPEEDWVLLEVLKLKQRERNRANDRQDEDYSDL